jgi:predicted acylesterase/phospholipase RssA
MNETGQGPWNAVVFSGGGCRCCWQVGFWTEALAELPPPRVVGAVSAGAAMACGIYAAVVHDVIADFKQRAAANRRNFYPGNLLNGRPAFPHEQIYRSTLLDCFGEEDLARLHRGPEIRILIGRPPRWAGAFATVGLGLAAELARRSLGRDIHASWGRRFGFRPEVVTSAECATPTELVELILQSSCMPPMLPLYRRDDHPVVDGGVIETVPVDAASPARTMLVLLTGQHAAATLPSVPGRTYVQPSRPLTVSTWDYTSPEGVQDAYDLGRRDGERWLVQQR